MKKLGFGLMRLPQIGEGASAKIDFETVCAMVDRFLEQGFTYFDTAYMYMEYQSEEILRRAVVERHPRDSFTVADKMPTMFLKKKEDLPRIFQEQQQKCGVDYFDYYLLHSLNTEHYHIAEKLGAFEFVSEMKRQGKVKQMGFSFHDTADVLDTILTQHPEVDFVQLQINYLDWDSEKIQSRLCYETAVRHHKPVIVMEPVKGGSLAKVPQEAELLLRHANPNASVSSWAIRYAASLDQVMMVLSGMSTVEQLEDNTGYMKDFQPLTPEEENLVEQVKGIIQDSIAIPCTGCEYCTDGCPQEIPIPQCFARYNEYKQHPSQGLSLEGLPGGNPIDCIECGQCESICPEHLPIISLLKQVEQAAD